MSFQRVMRVLGVLLAAAVTWTAAVDARAEAPAPVFRVFLKDGTALACWGEYAEVGDHLVLNVPVGAGTKRAYEFVQVPLALVDMTKTERYAEAVRAAQFASTRGAAEYAELRDRLAKQLAAIPLLPDHSERIAAAESARQQLIDWANTSHGYRAKEVHQLLQVFESMIIDVRVAAGESRFAINLSSVPVPPAPPVLRKAPTANETVALALRAAAVTDDEEVRKALLKRARSVAAGLPGEDGAAMRKAVAARFVAEARLDGGYRWLATDAKRQAASAVERGDARAINALRQKVIATDKRWGGRRPFLASSLMASLDAYYQAAAEQRLVLDQWESVRRELTAYQTKVAPLVARLDRISPLLTAIREFASTPLTDLVRVQEETAGMISTVAGMTAPAGAADAQRLLGQAIERADFAVRTRHTAVETRQIALARDAATAAADARARLTDAKTAVAALVHPPKAAQPGGDPPKAIR